MIRWLKINHLITNISIPLGYNISNTTLGVTIAFRCDLHHLI
jgi:hypothetical protein